MSEETKDPSVEGQELTREKVIDFLLEGGVEGVIILRTKQGELEMMSSGPLKEGEEGYRSLELFQQLGILELGKATLINGAQPQTKSENLDLIEVELDQLDLDMVPTLKDKFKVGDRVSLPLDQAVMRENMRAQKQKTDIEQEFPFPEEESDENVDGKA